MSAEAVVTTEQFEYLKQENALLREQVEFLMRRLYGTCLLYTSDAADDTASV